VTFEVVAVAGGQALRVSADRAWLRDPARVYPVRVDPTTTTSTTGDVFVDNDASTGSAAQNGTDLTVGTFNDGTTVSRSFIHFDQFGADGLSGKRIVGARLKAYMSWTYDCTHPTWFSVYRATSYWTVAGLSTSGLWVRRVGSDRNRDAVHEQPCVRNVGEPSIGVADGVSRPGHV
jgi:hypothetical protein